jgi:4-carboxymuconolactone decarboxylase
MERAMQFRREVFGEVMADALERPIDEYVERFWSVVQPFAFGRVWTRTALDPKTRTLVTVAQLAVMNRPVEFGIWLRNALRVGWTKDEIFEVVLQTMLYAGGPTGVDALRTAREAFAEHDRDDDAALIHRMGIIAEE